MPELDIATFCRKHCACTEGSDWALANCRDMADAWDKLKPEWLIWVATRPGVLTERQHREFACWCVRNTPLGDGRVAERFARGDAAGDVAIAAAIAAASAAAWAASDAANAAAREAARAARDAAIAVAMEAWAAGEAGEAARAAAMEAQAAHLRTLPNPFVVEQQSNSEVSDDTD